MGGGQGEVNRGLLEKWQLVFLSDCDLLSRYKYDSLFDSLNPVDGKVTGASAKGELLLTIL